LRRILHISDVHFGPPHLRGLSDGIIAMVEARRPNLVVVSGDLTQRAKPEQFRQARAFVDSLPAPTITVPGNHDVPLWRVWERVFDPYGAYRKHFDGELEPLYEDDELFVVGLNTAHGWTFTGGRIRATRLEQVAKLFERTPERLFKVVVAHHHLIPPPRFGTQRVSWNAAEAVDLFSTAGVDLILSGHQHQAFIANTEEFYPKGRPPVVILHSGTTTSNRGRGSEKDKNTCYWLEVDSQLIRVSLLLWEASAERFAEHSRHFYPRQERVPYTLEGLGLGPFDSAE
jgi:3',5'-cyclic AMP phosphodiesterase CpdA